MNKNGNGSHYYFVKSETEVMNMKIQSDKCPNIEILDFFIHEFAIYIDEYMLKPIPFECSRKNNIVLHQNEHEQYNLPYEN